MEWRDIPGYEGLYQISTTGLIKSCGRIVSYTNSKGTTVRRSLPDKLMIINPKKGGAGYRYVNLSKDGETKIQKISILMANVFLDRNLDDYWTKGLVVDHINGDRSDDRLENLQVITQRENIRKSNRFKDNRLLGYSFDKQKSKFVSYIYRKEMGQIFIGYFSTHIEAHKAYMEADEILNSSESIEEAKQKIKAIYGNNSRKAISEPTKNGGDHKRHDQNQSIRVKLHGQHK